MDAVCGAWLNAGQFETGRRARPNRALLYFHLILLTLGLSSMATKPLAAQAGKVGERVEPRLAGNVNRFGEIVRPTVGGLLAQKFFYPPFSVLSARDGVWQDRKRAWIGLGIQSELGRGGALLDDAAPGGSAMPAMNYKKGQRGDSHGKPVTVKAGLTYHADKPGGMATDIDTYRRAAGMKGNPQAGATLSDGTRLDRGVSATSVFDPVLCELAYSWWCPAGGKVLDPFAGGSVRGIVASILGLEYFGHELSEPQVAANRVQAEEICKDVAHKPTWIQGDSVVTLAESDEQVDFVFSCPPYGDLERYSDDPRDLSTMSYEDFLTNYTEIIRKATARLKPGGLACFVVGDYRDSDGYYHGFVADTVCAFVGCGLPLYNDAVLLTAVGSLPVRTSAQFESGRKLGKAHQNILVFIKPA